MGPVTFLFAPLLLNWFYVEMAGYFLRKKKRRQMEQEVSSERNSEIHAEPELTAEELEEEERMLRDRLSFPGIYNLHDLVYSN